MIYVAPRTELRFVLEDLCGLADIAALPGFADAAPEDVDAVLAEAARFAEDVLTPLNRAGDRVGAVWRDGAVTTPPGWREAYARMVEGGWNSPAASADHGGMGLPWLVNAAIQEMFQAANMAFQLAPLLTQGAIEALSLHGAPELQARYLPKLVSGEWSGAMDLTEPQAGSDLSALRTRAVPDGDAFRLFGQKIYITYGEHDLTENIVHLVLARLPDAPAGVKGISLFVCPKVLVNPDGSLGARNDLRCVSIEDKLGIHASPTCTLAFGDGPGAQAWLVGEANRGLEYMFAMMNNARLAVGLQGVGVAERACQRALAYARERRQGRAPGAAEGAAIVAHPDVRRMLGLMRARTDAARILTCRAAAALDMAAHAPDPEVRARAQRRVDLLIPVAKGWATETAVETASLGVQVHGGMGYVEDSGAAQHLRDARITTIYEGTTGIQALDLVGRKIQRDSGRAVRELTAEMRATEARLAARAADARDEAADWAALAAGVGAAAGLMDAATDWLLQAGGADAALSGAASVNVLHLFGVGLGAWGLADAADRAAVRLAAGAGDPAHLTGRMRLAEFYAAQILPEARARFEAATVGAPSVARLTESALG